MYVQSAIYLTTVTPAIIFRIFFFFFTPLLLQAHSVKSILVFFTQQK